MASSRDTRLARSSSHHRSFMSSTPFLNAPVRSSNSRHHSHSVSLGSLNATHRVTRRKSINSTTASNVAAMAAAISGANDPMHGSSISSHRRSLPAKPNADLVEQRGNANAMDSHLIYRDSMAGGPDSAVHDVAGDKGITSGIANGQQIKARGRRASEGAYLPKTEGRKVSGEIRCEKCGKGYKHSSCLTKHLWEHTPEWSYTSKLLISKHQQVQLLEAASVLVSMNQDEPILQEGAKNPDSEQSSASPTVSGASEFREDDYSSAETTPPPTSEHISVPDQYEYGRRKRLSSNSSAYGRSYQSAPSTSYSDATRWLGTFGASGAHGNDTQRPMTSGNYPSTHQHTDDEEASLAAAVQSLCSFGTPRSGPVLLPPDVPPVPPLPAQYASQNINRLSGSMAPPLYYSSAVPYTSEHQVSQARDVKIQHTEYIRPRNDEEWHNQLRPRGRSEEDDEGVFGRMEE